MKNFTRFATPLIAVAMMAAPMVMTAQSSMTSNNNQSNMSAPAGSEQEQAYKDGMEAAKLDTVAGRQVNPQTSYLYNHPPVKKSADKEAYRTTFTQGYKAALAKTGNGTGGL